MKKRATALLITVSIIFLLSLGISAGLFIVLSRSTKNRHFMDYTQCLLLADTGVEWARQNLGVDGDFDFADGHFRIRWGLGVIPDPCVGGESEVRVTATYPSPNVRSTIHIDACIDGSSNIVAPKYFVTGG